MLGYVGVHLHVCIVTELGGYWHVLVQRDDEPLLYTLVTTISYTTDCVQYTASIKMPRSVSFLSFFCMVHWLPTVVNEIVVTNVYSSGSSSHCTSTCQYPPQFSDYTHMQMHAHTSQHSILLLCFGLLGKTWHGSLDITQADRSWCTIVLSDRVLI